MFALRTYFLNSYHFKMISNIPSQEIKMAINLQVLIADFMCYNKMLMVLYRNRLFSIWHATFFIPVEDINPKCPTWNFQAK